MIGYGASAGKQFDRRAILTAMGAGSFMEPKIIMNGTTVTEAYLDDYGYPDYINSDVKTVNQVAHKDF